MHVVLVEPEIPPNTGNIARLCAATGSHLHLIEPLGFSLDERQLQRAGMDYWKLVRYSIWPDWPAFAAALPDNSRFWLIEQGGARGHHQTVFKKDDFLVFGRESAGLPKSLLAAHSDRVLTIPMPNAEARSLNLSNSVAIVLYEALRQLNFPPA